MYTSLAELADECYNNSLKHRFWEDDGASPRVGTVQEAYLIATKLALIHSEVSEALEELRKEDFNEAAFEEELIDILIRTLDLLGYYGTDVDDVLADKMKKNASRPPKHGKMF